MNLSDWCNSVSPIEQEYRMYLESYRRHGNRNSRKPSRWWVRVIRWFCPDLPHGARRDRW